MKAFIRNTAFVVLFVALLLVVIPLTATIMEWFMSGVIFKVIPAIYHSLPHPVLS
jgi:hypothetical protein